MEIRSFLAFELPKKIKGILSEVSVEMRKSPLNLKWVKVNNIHLTVIFIGNVSTELLDDMSNNISQVCPAYGPFDIAIKGAGVFSSKRNPRVLWIGLDGDIDKIADFRDTLQQELNPFGIKEEKRRYNPHLTIGRFRKGSKPGVHLNNLLEEHKNLTSPVCTLRELILFKSDLKPGGAVHTKLKTWPLGIED